MYMYFHMISVVEMLAVAETEGQVVHPAYRVSSPTDTVCSNILFYVLVLMDDFAWYAVLIPAFNTCPCILTN